MTHTFTTNLKCGGCVSKVRPALDAEPGVRRWEVDLTSPDRTLTVEGEAEANRVAEIARAAGFDASVVKQTLPLPTSQPPASYYPLALIVGYILGVVGLVEYTHGHIHAMRAMANFMAGFFLVFSFFKLLDVRAFADSYAMYDLIARRSRLYALTYPFVELALGVAYILRPDSMITNAVTLVVMLVGTAGVVESLVNRRRVRCACLGSVFNLPMSYVTLTEDLLMAGMAAVMLVL